MKIILERINESAQRYPTLGDWWFDADGTLQIRASADTDEQAFLYALHELVEAWLCQKRGITQEAVDAFDMQYERDRAAHFPDDESEPGDDPNAPYRREHRFAMLIEHLVARELGLDDYGVVL